MTATKRARLGPEDVVTGSRPVYRVGRALLCTYLTLLHRIRVEGREHLPRTGGVLIAANHQSFLDIPVIATGAPRHVLEPRGVLGM